MRIFKYWGIRDLRENKKLTLNDLENKSGISKTRLSLLENGRINKPHATTVGRIAEALGARPDFFWQDN